MSYSWKIQKAAVEQVILFPSQRVFDTYLYELLRKQESFELIDSQPNPDGSVTAIIRKRYNQNDYMPSSERSLQNTQVQTCVIQEEQE